MRRSDEVSVLFRRVGFEPFQLLQQLFQTGPALQVHRHQEERAQAVHHLVKIYHDEAKATKRDALIISHTFSPYFDDIVDMLRLQDIYTDNADIRDQMEHRARVGRISCPGCVIHTDQHPMPSLAAWRSYARFQEKIGNPCLYYVTGVETTHEPFAEEDFQLLRDTWAAYHKKLDKEYGPKKK